MIIKCIEKDRDKLVDYLKEEAVYNTFLLADIADFGFDSDFQTVYADVEDEKIKGVYLCFYKNLLLYTKENHINEEFLSELFKEKSPDVVLGKWENVSKVHERMAGYILSSKNLYLLEDATNLEGADVSIREGILSDVDEIFDFIQTIPEIKGLYTSKQMIHDRIEKKTGTHYLIRSNGKVIAHANSAARSDFTTMIGGVATEEIRRGEGIAGSIVSLLCRDILADGRKPSLFCDREEEQNLFYRIGFRKAGKWGTMIKGK